MADSLTARTLNRTTLRRQLLLRACSLDALSAVHQLVGLQAQVPANPYPGLWSRLDGFDASDLGTLLVERQVVRIASIRGTIHLLTADDCLAFWPLFRPVFDRELAAHPEVGPALAGVDLDPVLSGRGRCWATSRSPFPRSAQRWASASPRTTRPPSRTRAGTTSPSCRSHHVGSSAARIRSR